MLWVGSGCSGNLAAPYVGEHGADDEFHLACDLDEVFEGLIDFVLFHVLVAGKDEVFALYRELAYELLPRLKVESPERESHFQLALSPEDFCLDVVA